MKRGFVLVGLVFTVLMVLVLSGICIASDLSLMVSDINPSSVKANEDFTVGIQVWNPTNGDIGSAQLEVLDLGSDLSLKENKITDLGSMAMGGARKNIIYHFRTSADAVSGERTIKLRLSWKNSNNADIGGSMDYTFSITVKSDEPKLTFSGISSKPERVMENDDVILTLKIQNYGDGTAENIRAYVENLSFEGVKDTYIGKINPDEELPARFVLKAGNAGEYDYNVRILYEVNGREEERTFSSSIYVFKQSSSYGLYIALAGVVCVALVLWYNYRLKKKVKKLEEMKL